MGESIQSAAERQRIAFTLRLAGLTWSEVAKHDHNGAPLYSDGSAAYRAAQAYEKSQAHGDNLMEQRALDMARFDALQRAMWRKALAGDLPAAKFCLELMKARQKMLGVQNLQARESIEDPLDELAKKRGA